MYRKSMTMTLITLSIGLITACGSSGSEGAGGAGASSVNPATTIENVGEGKSCLIGKWRPDLDDLAILQKEVMGADTVTIRGTVVMEFLEDGENVKTDVPSLITDAKMPGQPLTSVEMVGFTNATYFANDDEATLQVTTVDFQYLASTEVFGVPLEIPITSEDGLFSSFLGQYSCTGNTLIIQTGVPQKSIARLWHRIP